MMIIIYELIYKTINVAQDSFCNLLKTCIDDIPIKREIQLRHISILNSVIIDIAEQPINYLGGPY